MITFSAGLFKNKKSTIFHFSALPEQYYKPMSIVSNRFHSMLAPLQSARITIIYDNNLRNLKVSQSRMTDLHS
jgi:hypothetical protein